MKTNDRTGYMCKVDFDHELGAAAGGAAVYATLDDLKRCRDCTDMCGIVRVKVTLDEVIQEGVPYSKRKKPT